MKSNYEETVLNEEDFVESVEISEIINPDGSIVEDMNRSKYKSNSKSKGINITIDENSPWYLRALTLIFFILVIGAALLFSSFIIALAVIFMLLYFAISSIKKLFNKRR